MDNFKCSVCDCEKSHVFQRMYSDADKPIATDAVITVQSYMFDFRLIMRACEECHTVKADWEKITESPDVTEEDKGRVRDLQKRREDISRMEEEK